RQTLVKKLLPLALLVTPNIPEAEILAVMEIKTIAAMKKAAKVIQDCGAKNVLIKGGHLPLKKEAIDILYDGREFYEFYAPRINTPHTHGTGCTYASAIAARLARGEEIAEAVFAAKELVTAAIKNSVQLGTGHGSVNILGDLIKSKR
ncbi:MAG TPA: PfkB family carbohydrate kinase, partial [Smithellaceae bacterium]|nr:PfkB family carbohydrate kinase [Smithellaceae bacterium]